MAKFWTTKIDFGPAVRRGLCVASAATSSTTSRQLFPRFPGSRLRTQKFFSLPPSSYYLVILVKNLLHWLQAVIFWPLVRCAHKINISRWKSIGPNRTIVFYPIWVQTTLVLFLCLAFRHWIKPLYYNQNVQPVHSLHAQLLWAARPAHGPASRLRTARAWHGRTTYYR